jgi:hypothetical protein
MNTWLDTETKSLLQRSPPVKLAPSDTATFTVVLLKIVGSVRGCLHIVKRLLECSLQDALLVFEKPLPIPLKNGLSHEDALLDQFELISCDCISVFLADDVVTQAPKEYLIDLYSQLLKSSEFEIVPVRIEYIPDNQQGEQFLRQFLGRTELQFPSELKVLRKKARIMQHWVTKIGGSLSLSIH